MPFPSSRDHPPPPPPPPPRRNPASNSDRTTSPAVREPMSQNGWSSHHNMEVSSLAVNTSLSPSRPEMDAEKTRIRATINLPSSPPRPATKISEESPLEAAASLIKTLDLAHTEMTGFAADAARDAESARRNARVAQEIARQYQNRSYPKTKSTFEDITVSELSTSGTVFGGDSPTAPPDCHSAIKPRPRPPKIKNLYTQYGNEEDNGDNHESILAIAAESNATPTSTANSTTQNGGKRRNADGVDVLQNGNPPKLSSLETSNGSRKAHGFYTPSSVDRIAQRHAEELLQLSMELERTKQELKSERRLHQECKTELESMKFKTESLMTQNQKLLEELEQQKSQTTQQVSSLQEEVETGLLRIQAAEEDAQLALDLAKDSAEQRDQLEEELQRAVQEIEQLQTFQHAAFVNHKMNGVKSLQLEVDTHNRHVRFVDDECVGEQSERNEGKSPNSGFGTPLSFASSRSLVAAGRQILRRQTVTTSPEEAELRLELTPAISAERRQRLRQRMTELDAVIESSSSTLMLSPPRGSTTPMNSPLRFHAASSGSKSNYDLITKKKLDEYQVACKILQTSGRRLDLDGYWWRDHADSLSKSTALAHPIQLDVMTRQYCQNVEFMIDRQEKEINELESLCGYLEKKLVMDTSAS